MCADSRRRCGNGTRPCARALALNDDLGAFAGFQRLGWNYVRDPDGDPIDKPSSLAKKLGWLAEADFVGVDAPVWPSR